MITRKGCTFIIEPSPGHIATQAKLELFPSTIYGSRLGVRMVPDNGPPIFFHIEPDVIRTLLDMLRPTSSETEGVQNA